MVECIIPTITQADITIITTITITMAEQVGVSGRLEGAAAAAAAAVVVAVAADRDAELHRNRQVPCTAMKNIVLVKAGEM